MERKPNSKPAKSIGALASLPLFHKPKGRKIVVAGTTEQTIWKAELLAASGADVTYFHEDLIIGENAPVGVKYEGRKWKPEDLENAYIAVLGTRDNAEGLEYINAARKYGALVNVIDRPELCDFQFGAIVNRSPLVIGIHTNASSPALGQLIRSKLEIMFPEAIAKWLDLAANLRKTIKQKISNPFERRDFWRDFSLRALENGAKPPPTLKEIEDLMAGANAEGEVIIMGAGPGDAELLTLKSIRALARADIVMFDDLVSEEVLDFARREAELVNVGKRGGKPSVKQSEICRIMVNEAQKGKTVIRVKGGDSLIFARATEEILACRNSGVKVTLIPGISAAQGAASSLGISLTDRDFANRVQYLTAHDKTGELPSEINWQALADDKVTSVIFMPRRTIEKFVENALSNQVSPEMICAIIENATRPNQITSFHKLSELPKAFETKSVEDPALVIIGNILKNAAPEGLEPPGINRASRDFAKSKK